MPCGPRNRTTTRFLDPHAVRAFNEVVGSQLVSEQFPHLAAFIGRETPAQAFARGAKIMNDERRFAFGVEALLDAAEKRGTRRGVGAVTAGRRS